MNTSTGLSCCHLGQLRAFDGDCQWGGEAGSQRGRASHLEARAGSLSCLLTFAWGDPQQSTYLISGMLYMWFPLTWTSSYRRLCPLCFASLTPCHSVDLSISISSAGKPSLTPPSKDGPFLDSLRVPSLQLLKQQRQLLMWVIAICIIFPRPTRKMSVSQCLEQCQTRASA